MKKKNGFTLVEIIVSFALTMIVVLFLFQMIVTLKQVYNKNFLTSDLVVKQSNISQMINKDLLVSGLGNAISVSKNNATNCFDIAFQHGNRSICYNIVNNSIIYNAYEFELVEGSKVSDFNVYIDSGLLYINIPISYPDIDDKFDVKVAYIN